jgi:hypothetical protein
MMKKYRPEDSERTAEGVKITISALWLSEISSAVMVRVLFIFSLGLTIAFVKV